MMETNKPQVAVECMACQTALSEAVMGGEGEHMLAEHKDLQAMYAAIVFASVVHRE